MLDKSYLIYYADVRIADFLRVSRASVDDSISAQLNALLTPARNNPHSVNVSERPSGSSSSRGSLRRAPPSHACHAFKTQVLFPSWAARSSVLSYCGHVSDSSRKAGQIPSPAASSGFSMSPPTIDMADTGTQLQPTKSTPSVRAPRNYWGREQTVDERLDPYSARDYEWTRATKAQELIEILRTEEGVERIVRARTWGVLMERCGASARDHTEDADRDGFWETEWRDWKRRKDTESRD